MIGVMITDGMSTEWRQTMASMIDLYEAHPDVKMVVVALEDPGIIDRPRPDEVNNNTLALKYYW